jgi:hypothetical protein
MTNPYNKCILVLTTLLHCCSLFPSLYHNKINYNISILYNIVITLATIFSILWHLDETKKIIMYIDYLLAFIWLVLDIYIALLNYILLIQVLLLNFIIFYLNILIKKNESYYIYHSIWHIISSVKCLYTVYLFTHLEI